MTIEQFTNEFLNDLSPLRKAKAITHLLAMTRQELDERDLNYLLTLHNMNVSGVHTGGHFDPLVQKGIKAKLQTLKNKIQ